MQNSKLPIKVQSLGKFGLTKLFLSLTILLAPLYVIRFKIGSYHSTLLEVLIGLTVMLWLFEKIRARNLKLRASIFQLPIILFLFAAAISVVVSPDKRAALGIFKAYFVEPILVFLIIKDVVRSKRDWWLVFYALVLSGLWIALLTIFQGLTGQLPFAPHEAAQGRAHAVYNTANAVGLYLGPIAAIVLGVSVLPSLTLNILYFALMGFALIFTKSLGALIALLVVILCLATLAAVLHRPVLAERSGRVGKPLFLTMIILSLAGLGWFFFNISSFTPQVSNSHVRKSNDTLQFRLCLWEGTRNLLLERPIFGAGLSGFKELYSQKYFTCDVEPLEYPHNWILNFWTETGILGLAGFVFLLSVYFRLIKAHLINERERWLSLGFLAAMVYWLIHGLVDVPYFKNDLSLELWVVVGLVEALGFAF